MGWTMTGDPYETVKARILKGPEVVAYAISDPEAVEWGSDSKTPWVIWEQVAYLLIAPEAEPSRRELVVVLLREDRHDTNYPDDTFRGITKEIAEICGPSDCGCPLELLDLADLIPLNAPGYAQGWRLRCFDAAEVEKDNGISPLEVHYVKGRPAP